MTHFYLINIKTYLQLSKQLKRGIFVPHLLKLAPLTTLKQACKAEIVYTLSLHLCNYNSIYIYDNPCSPAVLLSKRFDKYWSTSTMYD